LEQLKIAGQRPQTLVWSKLFEYRLIVLMALLIVLMTAMTDGTFLQWGNIRNLLSQSAIVGILTIAQCLVILTGGIDLSVGAIMAAASLAYVIQQDIGLMLSILLAVAVGALFGAFNGFFVTRIKLTPFIVTLATMEIARGLSSTAVRGEPIFNIRSEFLTFGSMRPLGIPLQVYVWIVLVLATWFLLHRTTWGKAVYATGGNERAAKLSGIDTRRTKMSVYVYAGLLCAIAGILFTSRLAIGEPSAGDSYNLDSIAAVVIGGVALSGGEGKLSHAMIGVLIFAMLNNFMNLLGVSPFYQQALKGIIIILAIYVNIRKQGSRH